MGNRGRYGKYGEKKRLERLRNSRVGFHATRRKGIGAEERLSPFLKRIRESPFRVRLARPADVGYIRDLSRNAFQQYGPYDDVLSQWFELDTTLTLLACQGKKAVGFTMLGRSFVDHPIPFDIEVLAIAVERNMRRSGIGGLLLREIESAAHKLKVEKLQLHTASDNVPARILFKKYGFITAEVKKGFYPRGQDALMMFKEM